MTDFGDTFPAERAEWPEAIAQALAASADPASLLESFLEALPVAVYTTDRDGRVTAYNRCAAELWGRRPTPEDRWTGALHLYAPDGHPLEGERMPLAVAVATGEASRNLAQIVERPDGTRRHVLANPSPLRDGSGAVVGGVSLLVDIADALATEESRHFLAAIVDSSEDAIVGKTLDGIIVSWNAAAERLFGYSADEIIGRPVLTLIPPDRQNEETEILARLRKGERVEHFETVRRHKSGAPLDISLTISPVKRPDGSIVGASKIARDIGAQKQAEALLLRQTQQLQTLNRVARLFAQDLDFERIVQSVTDIGTSLSGAQFGAFFYNVADEHGESYQLFALSGAPREKFERFGMPRATEVFAPTFRGEGTILSGNIREDPRYGRNAPHSGMPEGHLPVTSYLAVPVKLGTGEVLGGLFFGHEEPDRFDEEAVALIEGIAALAATAMDNARLHRDARLEIAQREAAERDRELLLQEIKHRIKNTLATVQAIASHTFTQAPANEKQAFTARLRALASAHDMLTAEWSEVPLGDLVQRAVRPFEDPEGKRFAIEVPPTSVCSRQAFALSLALHELATNAIKYGALSAPGGRVEISATQQGGALALVWRECDGPPVEPPTRQGFGTRMISHALNADLGEVRLDWAPTGLVCTIRLARD